MFGIGSIEDRDLHAGAGARVRMHATKTPARESIANMVGGIPNAAGCVWDGRSLTSRAILLPKSDLFGVGRPPNTALDRLTRSKSNAVRRFDFASVVARQVRSYPAKVVFWPAIFLAGGPAPVAGLPPWCPPDRALPSLFALSA